MAELRVPSQNPWWGLPASALKKVKELSQALAQSSDPFAGAAGNLAELLLGNAPETLEKLSYGERVTSGKGETLHMDPGVLDVAGMVPSPGKAIPALKAVAVALADKLPAAAAIGAIRSMGDPSLFLHHGSRIDSLLEVKDAGLISPSMAITAGPLHNTFAGEGGVTLIAKEGAFDPAYSTSTLLNRDAYVSRSGDYRQSKYYHSPTRQEALNRIEDRFLGPLGQFQTPGAGIKFGEGPSYPQNMDLGHQAAIWESPVFKSFKEFERSPAGARLLFDQDPRGAGKDLQGAVETWFDTRGIGMPGEWSTAKDYLTYFAKNGDPAARQLLQLARRIPSEYAELKVHGAVPITPEYWAGAIANLNLADGDEVRRLVRYMHRKNLPVVDSGMTGSEAAGAAEQLQKEAGPYGRKSLGEFVSTSPEAIVPGKPWADRFSDLPRADTMEASAVPVSTLKKGAEGALPKIEHDPSSWGIAPEIQKFLKEISDEMVLGEAPKLPPKNSAGSMDFTIKHKTKGDNAPLFTNAWGDSSIKPVPAPDSFDAFTDKHYVSMSFPEVSFENASPEVVNVFNNLIGNTKGYTSPQELEQAGLTFSQVNDILDIAHAQKKMFSELSWTAQAKVLIEWAKKNVP